MAFQEAAQMTAFHGPRYCYFYAVALLFLAITKDSRWVGKLLMLSQEALGSYSRRV